MQHYAEMIELQILIGTTQRLWHNVRYVILADQCDDEVSSSHITWLTNSGLWVFRAKVICPNKSLEHALKKKYYLVGEMRGGAAFQLKEIVSLGGSLYL